MEQMDKIQMLCYSGESWETTPISQKGIYDITEKTAEEVARLADLQQELMNRKVHIKRIVE